MGKAIRKCDVRRAATVASMAAILGVAMVREARAGCGDGACGRVDWTEVTDVDQGTPAAAKLHGAYAWEASPDGWGTHPIGGTFPGFLWVSCRPAGGAADATCQQALAAEMAKAGSSSSMITFGGSFFSPDAGVIQPPGLFRETQGGVAALYGRDLQLGGAPFNPQVCPAAFAIPRNGADAAVPDATPPTDATPPDDAHGAGGATTGNGGTTATGSGGASTGSGGGTAGTDPASGGTAGASAAPTSKNDEGGCA